MKNYLQRRNNDFGFNFFGDLFDDFFTPTVFKNRGEMRTDIREREKDYELSVDMPGFDKKDISLSLKDGYITLNAVREEKEEDGNYLRRERSMSMTRSFYVGENVTEEMIKAKYENGTLKLTLPKQEDKKIEEKHIEIE